MLCHFPFGAYKKRHRRLIELSLVCVPFFLCGEGKKGTHTRDNSMSLLRLGKQVFSYAPKGKKHSILLFSFRSLIEDFKKAHRKKKKRANPLFIFSCAKKKKAQG